MKLKSKPMNFENLKIWLENSEEIQNLIVKNKPPKHTREALRFEGVDGYTHDRMLDGANIIDLYIKVCQYLAYKRKQMEKKKFKPNEIEATIGLGMSQFWFTAKSLIE